MINRSSIAGKRLRKKWLIDLAFAAVFAVILAFIVFSVTACSAVVPKPVAAAQASFGDSGKQNSGFLGFVEGGALIDSGALARYNALTALYGAEFLPEIGPGYGIKSLATAHFISNDAFHKFLTMAEWKRMGRQPKR
jgi:predicted permease